MAFSKTFDEILSSALTYIQNQFAGADVSQGSIFQRMFAAICTVVYGLYEKLGFVARQIFPDQMTSANLIKFAAQFGLNKEAGETDSDFRTRVLSHIRQRASGGTKLDYQREALKVTGVKTAKVYGPDDGFSPGNVVVVLLSDPTTGTATSTSANKLIDSAGGFVAGMVGATVTNTDDDTTAVIVSVDSSNQLTLDADIIVSGEAYSIDSVIPSSNLVTAVETALTEFKPLTVELTVQGVTVYSTENITMTVTGDAADISSIVADITAYMNGLDIGEILYRTQLEAIAVNNGADSVNLTAPASDVSPALTEIVLPGTISVS